MGIDETQLLYYPKKLNTRIWTVIGLASLSITISILIIISTVKFGASDNYVVDNTVNEYKIKIAEGRLTEGCVVSLNPHRVDPDKKISSSNNNATDYSIVNKTYQSYFNIDASGCVKMKGNLTRRMNNNNKFIKLQIHPQDGGKSTEKDITLDIELFDENNHPPKLVKEDEIIEWEEMRMPGEIKKLEAYDDDPTENGLPFTYRLNPDKNAEIINKTFTLTEDGFLNGTIVFNYEKKNVYNISVLITDSGEPRMTGESWLTVRIIKNNDRLQFRNLQDSPIIIRQSEYRRYLNSLVVKLKLKNKSHPVRFEIISGNTDHHFRIDNETGEIYVNDIPVAYNDDKYYNLTVSATDDIFYITKNVVIGIKAETNHQIEFVKWNPSVDINVNEDVGNKCVANVSSVVVNKRNNDSITQHIKYGISEARHFNIDQFGCIRLIRNIKKNSFGNYEIQNSTKLIVYAFYDDTKDSQAEQITRSIEMNINLIDLNKPKANFQLETSVYHVLEGTSPGVIANLTVKDCSTNCNDFDFEIDKSTQLGKLFNISNNNQLNSLVSFSWKINKSIKIPVIITDKKTSASSSTILEIKIQNAIGKYQFTEARYFVSIFDNMTVDEDVVEVRVEPYPYFSVNYSIISGNFDDAFRLRGDTNVITVNKQLNHKNRSKYSLEVGAVSEKFNDSTIVDVSVEASGGVVHVDPEKMNLTMSSVINRVIKMALP